MTLESLTVQGIPADKTRVRVYLDTSGQRCGFTALELMAVVALTASLAAALVTGLGELGRATTLEGARQQLRLALRQAANLAYRRATTVELRVLADGTQLRISSAGLQPISINLPADVRLIGAPRRGGLRFYASGLADNATFILALKSSGETSQVVVNQRGLIR